MTGPRDIRRTEINVPPTVPDKRASEPSPQATPEPVDAWARMEELQPTQVGAYVRNHLGLPGLQEPAGQESAASPPQAAPAPAEADGPLAAPATRPLRQPRTDDMVQMVDDLRRAGLIPEEESPTPATRPPATPPSGEPALADAEEYLSEEAADFRDQAEAPLQEAPAAQAVDPWSRLIHLRPEPVGPHVRQHLGMPPVEEAYALLDGTAPEAPVPPPTQAPDFHDPVAKPESPAPPQAWDGPDQEASGQAEPLEATPSGAAWTEPAAGPVFTLPPPTGTPGPGAPPFAPPPPAGAAPQGAAFDGFGPQGYGPQGYGPQGFGFDPWFSAGPSSMPWTATFMTPWLMPPMLPLVSPAWFLFPMMPLFCMPMMPVCGIPIMCCGWGW